MAKESNGQEKTEQPTGKRLDDSREKGQVAKSMEINSLAIFGSGLILLFVFKEFIGNQLSSSARYIFSSLDTLEINANMIHTYAKGSLFFALKTLSPFFIGLVIIALAAGYGQTGFKITPKALEPKFSKFNILNGMKEKFFSATPLVELVKSVLKFSIIGTFAYFELKEAVQDSLGLIDHSVEEIVLFMIEAALSFLWKVAVIYLALAAADFAYQKHKHIKDLKMTKQEVKEETKQTEGDPQIKSQIKGKQMEMARSRMMKDVPEADVVITNPTHFAIALKYEMGETTAPKVVAKGMDFVAQKIKEIAYENEVPVHEDKQLARALYKQCEVGDEIPEELYKTVAQILAYVYRLKNEKKKSIV